MMMFLIGLELELLDLLQHLLCIVRRLRFLVGAMEAPCFAPIVPFLQLAFVAYSL